jgi:hypothetical protein
MSSFIAILHMFSGISNLRYSSYAEKWPMANQSFFTLLQKTYRKPHYKLPIRIIKFGRLISIDEACSRVQLQPVSGHSWHVDYYSQADYRFIHRKYFLLPQTLRLVH